MRSLGSTRQLFLISSRRLYTAVNTSTTFEVQDRPYATILKSGLATPKLPEPTLMFSPRSFVRIGGALLFVFPISNCRLAICRSLTGILDW